MTDFYQSSGLERMISSALAFGLVAGIFYLIERNKKAGESGRKQQENKASEDVKTDVSFNFKGISKEEAIRRWRADSKDKRTWGQVVGDWEKANTMPPKMSDEKQPPTK